MLMQDGVFSDEQTLAAAAAASNNMSTNYLDLESAGGTIKDFRGDEKANNIGDVPMRLIVRVGDSALDAATTGATITIGLYVHSATTSIHSGTLLASKTTGSIDDAGANFPAGTLLWKLDLTGLAWDVDLRYLALNYLINTQNMSTGTINAYIIPASQDDFGDEQAA
jgi:hypothetical protein